MKLYAVVKNRVDVLTNWTSIVNITLFRNEEIRDEYILEMNVENKRDKLYNYSYEKVDNVIVYGEAEI